MYGLRRHLGISAVVHLETRDQGSNPVVSIVGWSYIRSGATLASHRPRDLLLERELGRVGWGTFSLILGSV